MQTFALIGRDPKDRDATLLERQKRVDRFVESNATRAVGYVSSPPLRAAVDVALTLGRPLLLTGEPGSGKTLAAYWLAAQLGLPDSHVQRFQVRSDSRARDACYQFDTVSWFRDSQIPGKAVEKSDFVTPEALGKAFGWLGGEDANPHLVLIDEIDKAPRDFPNDLLQELDEMKFTILETGQTIGPPKQRPILVITSNAERRLPDPFLRRCVTHHIEIGPETVLEILRTRLKGYRGAATVAETDGSLVEAGAAFWSSLAEMEGQFARKPTIAEFWQWLVLASEYPDPEEKIDLVGILKKKRGPEIARLPRIGALFLPADLTVISHG